MPCEALDGPGESSKGDSDLRGSFLLTCSGRSVVLDRLTGAARAAWSEPELLGGARRRHVATRAREGKTNRASGQRRKPNCANGVQVVCVRTNISGTGK
jgi:hypothetical protein